MEQRGERTGRWTVRVSARRDGRPIARDSSIRAARPRVESRIERLFSRANSLERVSKLESDARAPPTSRAVGDPSHLKLGDKSSRPSGGMMSGSSFSSTSKATSSKIYLFASASASSSSSSYGRIIARLHSPRRAAVLTVYIHLTVVDAVSSILTPRARTYDSPDLARSPTGLYRALTVARGSIASPTRARA